MPKSKDYPWDLPESCFEAPDFWVSGLQECYDFIRALPAMEVMQIGNSAGGRPILAAAWGEREPLKRTSTSLSSSLGAAGGKGWDFGGPHLYPNSFFGEKPREKPVLVIQGNLHGSEIEGTVATMSLLNLLAHGTDLRGRKHARLLAEARKMRIVVIPHANADGRARWEPAKHLETATHEQQQRVTMGRLADGTELKWPSCKEIFPIPPGGLLGAYYTDAGVNLNHDRFLDADRAPETDALLSFYLEEMPDAVVIAHTDQGTLLGSAPPCVPQEIQVLHDRIAGAVAAAIRQRRLPIQSYPQMTRPGGFTRAFTQPDAVYHQCGATPLMVEFPCNTKGNNLDFDTILDVGLCVLETIIIFGNDLGFRPCLRKHLGAA